MALRRFLQKIMRIAVIVISIAIVYDLVLWKYTFDRIDKISSLCAGMSVPEAIAYLEENRKPLQIAEVEKYRGGEKEWLVVELKKVSYLGVIYSIFCSPKCASLEISGLLRMSIEDGQMTSSWPIL